MAKSFVSLAILALSSLSLASAYPFDPISLRLDNRSVFFGQERLNWFKASEMCRKHGLQLVSIQSNDENIEISTHGQFLDYNSLWTAASDLAENGRWVWSTTGEQLKVIYWAKNEPGAKEENCIEVTMKDAMWRSTDCQLKRQYACEEIVKKDGSDNGGFWKMITDFVMGKGQ